MARCQLKEVNKDLSTTSNADRIQNLYIQGVPKKRWISVQTAVEGIRSDLWLKVGGVLENSGNFLSDEYKNSLFLSEND